jgi:hypothetical protein
MRHRASYLVAIIVVCLSWIIPIITLVQIVRQQESRSHTVDGHEYEQDDR